MSWNQLLGMIQEQREWEHAEATRPPVECPNDYTPLREGPGGVLFCPWDGWQYPTDA